VTVFLASAGSATAGRFLVTWFVVGLIATIVLQPFQRRIGGQQATGGGPGGAEPAIIGVTWFLAALATGIYIAHDAMSSVAVG
jgi:hypothetical protein